MLRYLEIKQQLQNMIAETAPRERLPDRVTLCKLLDTTRTTLDKAIAELIEEGMLNSRKGSGTFVTEEMDGKADNDSKWFVIVPNILEPIFNNLVNGIETVAQQKGANIVLCSSDNLPTKQQNFVRRLIRSNTAGGGIILVPVTLSNPLDNYRMYSNMIASDIPVVFCNRAIEGINVPIVTSNDFYGGYIATKHLLDHGYRRIVYISRYKYRTSTDRCQGYMSALLERGIPIDRKLICVPDSEGYTFDCAEAIRRLLATTLFDAVFCFDDLVAIKVGEALRDAGKVISDEVGIIGYNNNAEICEACSPALTSVAYKANEIGQKAGEVLYNLIHKKKRSSTFEYYLFQPEIVPRDTCKGPRVSRMCFNRER